MADQSYVVISRADDIDYSNDYVSLPSNYGTPEYYDRADVKSIIQTLNDNLYSLNTNLGFIDKLTNKKVVIKPNLVTVCNNIGFERENYPNTTDPRLIDALIIFLKEYTDEIVIAESSGRSFPTRGSMRVAGIDKIAENHNIDLVYLEEEAVDRYILPKARVMKECIVPKIFTEVAEGDAFYISLPKMKTNLYTDVTLGFKNGMGCISYNLRQRNHHFNIDQKLVDMLYLFKPDLVIIDGIVGAEGQSPCAVDPVQSNMIISGNNCVETDRVASRIMGFNPDDIKLMQIASEMGFGDPDVEVIGDDTPIPFRKANTSLMDDEFKELFPNVKVLMGFQFPHSPVITSKYGVTREIMLEMEKSCKGGCQATTRLGFEYLNAEGADRNFKMVLIMGNGVKINGTTYYFDRDGKAYSFWNIFWMSTWKYGKRLAIGSCTKEYKHIVRKYVDGCMPMANDPHMAIHDVSGRSCKVVNLIHNKNFLTLATALLQMRAARIAKLKDRVWLDCDMNTDSPDEGGPDVDLRELTPEEMEMDYVLWEFPEMSWLKSRDLINDEWCETINLFL